MANPTSHADIFITDIEKDSIANGYYRSVVFTSSRLQIVLMSIKPKSDIPLEIHNDNDQFIRIEQGNGILYIGSNKESKYVLKAGVAVLIPAGTYHQVVNTDNADLKLYTIYSPPHHARDLVDVDKPVQCQIENDNNNNNNANSNTRSTNFAGVADADTTNVPRGNIGAINVVGEDTTNVPRGNAGAINVVGGCGCSCASAMTGGGCNCNMNGGGCSCANAMTGGCSCNMNSAMNSAMTSGRSTQPTKKSLSRYRKNLMY